MAEDAKAYLDKLGPWGLHSLALIAVAIITAILTKYLGTGIAVPPPPPIVVVSPDGSPVKVTVIRPE